METAVNFRLLIFLSIVACNITNLIELTYLLSISIQGFGRGSEILTLANIFSVGIRDTVACLNDHTGPWEAFQKGVRPNTC